MHGSIINRKCGQCSLVNFADSESCRRCGAVLALDQGPAAEAPQAADPPRQRLLVVSAVVAAILFCCWTSLILTSNGLDDYEHTVVARAIAVLERNGFATEVRVLRYATIFRANDNWWNEYVGHRQAYAATNFPFEVVTLYPRFFQVAIDDTERAVILLHESQHLLGRGEEAALDEVWRSKLRLGWDAHNYGHTRVWKNTREWTQSSLPQLFSCGEARASDCF